MDKPDAEGGVLVRSTVRRPVAGSVMSWTKPAAASTALMSTGGCWLGVPPWSETIATTVSSSANSNTLAIISSIEA